MIFFNSFLICGLLYTFLLFLIRAEGLMAQVLLILTGLPRTAFHYTQLIISCKGKNRLKGTVPEDIVSLQTKGTVPKSFLAQAMISLRVFVRVRNFLPCTTVYGSIALATYPG